VSTSFDIAAIRDAAVTLWSAALTGINVRAYPSPGGALPSLTLDAAEEDSGYAHYDDTFQTQTPTLYLSAELVLPILGDIPSTLRAVDGYLGVGTATSLHDVFATHRTLGSLVGDVAVVRSSRPVPVVETGNETAEATAVMVSMLLKVMIL
jgi:hypothetical protein